MNPNSFINLPPYFPINPRDRTKSYLQSVPHNQFLNNQPLNNVTTINSSGVYQSDKYKNYYNQYQDYRQPSVPQLQSNYATQAQRQVRNRPKDLYQQKMSGTSLFGFLPTTHQSRPDRSEQRKRFHTTTGSQRDNMHFRVEDKIKVQSNPTHSMIFFSDHNQQQRFSSNKRQGQPKKDIFKLVNHKFASSGVESTFNNKDKKGQVNRDRPQSLLKANKKISLKRDVAANGPNNLYFQGNQNEDNEQGRQQRHKAKSYFQPLSTEVNAQKGINSLNKLPSLQRFSSSNSQLSQNVNKQISFKKNPVTTYQFFNSDLASSQLSSNNQVVSPSTTRGLSQTFFGSIKQNKTNVKGPPSQTIDSQIYTDMKISRIQSTTTNLEQKVQNILKKIQVLSHHSKQHQNSLNQINQHIGKQEQQGITPHDMRRIKKQLKIMKTNFQTAFTSMTQQINRKLIKQENIMKSLSEEIRVVAQQNQKLGQVLQDKSRKVQSLQKSMTGFMRENQERMESLVLNQSFSSSKRSKNNSLEYGLDLKNMSGQENYMGKQQSFENLNRKFEGIQREIKKIKIFHIEQQQSYKTKFSELGEQIQRTQNHKNKAMNQNQIEQLIRQITTNMMSIKLQGLSSAINERQDKKLNLLKQQIEVSKLKMQEFHKVFHQELYEFRMNKLQGLNSNNLKAESKNQTIDSQLDQQLASVLNKQRSLLVTITQCQQKIIYIEEKQHNIQKNLQDKQLKDLRTSGDIRELQSIVKQFKQQISQLRTFRDKSQSQSREMAKSITLHTSSLSNVQQKFKQLDGVNAIQTQNIQSINNQFERVINRQIIPKFEEIHQINNEINKKIFDLSVQIHSKKTQSNYGNGQKNNLVDKRQVEKKIEQYFSQNVQKFIKSKVKVVSTRLISSNQLVDKLGLFKRFSESDISIDEQQNVRKEQTYLVDQQGYLMDWQGSYLTQTSEHGSRTKIKLTQQQIYFMQVNGIDIERKQLK